MKVLSRTCLFVVLVITPATADFIVHDENYPAHWIKDHPSVSCDSAGNSVFVWYDLRKGTPTIFAQRLDRFGNSIGGNFQVNEDSILSIAAKQPSVACDRQGRFTVAFEGLRIYARRFSAGGIPQGPSIQVAGRRMHDPWVAINRNGNWAIVWAGPDSVVNQQTFARIYDSSGVPLDTAFAVSESLRCHRFPTIASVPNGRFAVAWGLRSGGPQNVCCQLLDSVGTRIGPSFTVNDSGEVPMYQRCFSISTLQNNTIVLAWGESIVSRIFTRLFLPGGQPIGPSIRINDSPWSNSHPSVGSIAPGTFVVCWRLRSAGIMAQRLDSLGARIGANFLVNDTIGPARRDRCDYPCVVGNPDRFFVAWRKRRDPFVQDISMQVYDAQGNPQGLNRRLSDDKGCDYQCAPSIAVAPDKRLFVTWTDTRNKWMDLYLKVFDSLGTPLTSDTRVSSDTFFDLVDRFSSAACNGRNFIATWYDDADTWFCRPQILGQRFDLMGRPLGQRFCVSDSSAPYACVLDASSRGDFVAAWLKMWPPVNKFDVWARRYDSLANQIGQRITVSDTADWTSVPDIRYGRDGRFAVVWPAASSNIYLQRFDTSGNRIGANVVVNDSLVEYSRSSPKLAFDHAHNIIVTWAEERDLENVICGQRFDSSGARIGGNFRVSTAPDQALRACPAVVARNANEFFICWQDEFWGTSDILGQYYRDGAPVGPNQRINQNVLQGFCEAPSVRADSTKIYLAWSLVTRYPYNYDVYAKILNWADLTSAEDFNGARLVSHNIRIWPNPSKGGFTIEIPNAGSSSQHGQRPDQSLKIHDASGRLVKSFKVTPDILSPASAIHWDGCDKNGRELPNGVYFCSFRRDRVVSNRKLVIIR